MKGKITIPAIVAGRIFTREASVGFLWTFPPATLLLLECACGEDLSREPALNFQRRQVFDLPVLRLECTEHQAEIKECPCCSRAVRARRLRQVKAFLDAAIARKDAHLVTQETLDKEHGRIEERRYLQTSKLEWFTIAKSGRDGKAWAWAKRGGRPMARKPCTAATT